MSRPTTVTAEPLFDPAWMQAQTQRGAALTELAVRGLGLSATDAAGVAQGKGMAMGPFAASIGCLPVPRDTPQAVLPMLVTLSTRRPLSSLSLQDATAVMSLAPMLGLYGASVGCDAHGHLCLFRVVPAEAATAEGLEAAVRHAWHLAQLVWGEVPVTAGAL
jgi:hypothetical protein